MPHLLWNADSMRVLSNDALPNDLEWPLCQISRSRRYLTLNISETVRYIAIM